MFRQFLLGKLHRVTVTRADLDYVGSVSIDRELMDAAGILPYEKIQIINIDNGERFESYAIEAPAGSKVIGMNGGTAYLAKPGDICLIIAYTYLQDGEVAKPRSVMVGEGNIIEAVIEDEIPIPVLSMELVETG